MQLYPYMLLLLLICWISFNIVMKESVVQVPSKTGGPPEKKDVLLEELDPVWLELRHAHIADVCILSIVFIYFEYSWYTHIDLWLPCQASEQLHEKMTNFVSKNKAAQLQHTSRLV